MKRKSNVNKVVVVDDGNVFCWKRKKIRVYIQPQIKIDNLIDVSGGKKSQYDEPAARQFVTIFGYFLF